MSTCTGPVRYASRNSRTRSSTNTNDTRRRSFFSIRSRVQPTDTRKAARKRSLVIMAGDAAERYFLDIYVPLSGGREKAAFVPGLPRQGTGGLRHFWAFIKAVNRVTIHSFSIIVKYSYGAYLRKCFLNAIVFLEYEQYWNDYPKTAQSTRIDTNSISEQNRRHAKSCHILRDKSSNTYSRKPY